MEAEKDVKKMSLYEMCKTRNIELTHYADAKKASTDFQVECPQCWSLNCQQDWKYCSVFRLRRDRNTDVPS